MFRCAIFHCYLLIMLAMPLPPSTLPAHSPRSSRPPSFPSFAQQVAAAAPGPKRSKRSRRARGAATSARSNPPTGLGAPGFALRGMRVNKCARMQMLIIVRVLRVPAPHTLIF